ncbi:indigoidine synthase A-like protein, partial [Ramicandelaber brevisporus]
MYSALRRFSTSAATRRSAWRGLPPRFTATPEVLSALKNGEPVVALESTIISHGMPFPDNLRTAQAVEKAVRDAGSIPATIAILDGEVHVGLSADNLARFAETPRNQVTKTSRRDFAAVMADRNRMGATTVASTVMAAHRAGISLFATGGIGGVHRGGESTMDVSADLTELGRSPVAVVCAGVKSILDIGRTLEYLETQGVTVATLGETDDFPAFFVPKSGFRSPYQIKSAAEAAEIVRANRDLNAQSGMVFAVPIPADQAADAALIEKAIQQAIREMDEQGVAGRDATPFILGRVAQLTGGSSLAANIALVVNNARVGGEIARKVA